MTKGEIIGTILVKLGEGYPNNEMKYHWDDIAVLIAPCSNYIQTQQYYLEKREEDGDRGVNPLMLQVFEDVAVFYNKKRGQFCAKLPRKPISSIPKGRAVSYVGNHQGKAFIPSDSNNTSMDEYYGCFKKNVTSYTLEQSTIWLKHVLPGLKYIMIKMIVDNSELGDDDEILLPDGTEPQLMEMIIDILLGKRILPNDTINDGKDNSK